MEVEENELMERVILHRPYLRFDPAAYPESQEIVVNAATIILTAYETAFQTKASVFWVWWSIPYRVSTYFLLCFPPFLPSLLPSLVDELCWD
jgi:hypothetical protein